ncbi:MAG: flavodoxin domain-containing protein [Bacteroidota bacterium]
MATLLVYMTSHGCTKKAANLIRDLLPGEVRVVNLENSDSPPLDSFDTVIIGGSIRIGTLQKRIKKYCEKNLETLLSKKIGLFICCMFEKEVAMDQLKRNFPEILWQHASALGLFGGELEFEQLNAFERMIINQVANISVDVSSFNEEAVREFAERISDATLI